jgi:hypothetical protein
MILYIKVKVIVSTLNGVYLSKCDEAQITGNDNNESK